MRKITQLFSVPKDERVTEKHLIRVLVCSCVSILLCMNCLIGTTWAWYQTSIVSQGNEIRIGSFTASVTMQKGGRTSGAPLSPDSDEYTYSLSEVGTYTITITNNGQVEGYCTIVLEDAQGNRESFTSGTLYPAEDEDANDSASISITIDAQDKVSGILPVTLKIYPSWGKDPKQEAVDIDEEVFAPETTESTEETTAPTEETVSETTEETVPETTEETVPETTEETVPETTAETVPETTEETVPETTAETVPETTEALNHQSLEETTESTEETTDET